jgi:hypothetical protein
MNALADGAIAIDTNVFMHLFHKGADANASTCNLDSHIDALLERLQRDKLVLLIDNKQKIAAEHIKYLYPILEGDEIDTKRLILRYWILDRDPIEIALDTKSQLYGAIEKIIHEKAEAADRAYVFVSHCAGKPLVTNDEMHILFGPTSEGNTDKNNRRTRLKKATKKLCAKGACIVTSREAFDALGEEVTDTPGEAVTDASGDAMGNAGGGNDA